MNRIKIKILFTFFSLALFSGTALSQSKVGTTIGQFLKIDPSARGSAMGYAGTSLFGDANFSFYNAASLGRVDNVDVQFTHIQWFADIVYNYAVAAIPVEGIGTLSLHAISLNSGEIDVRTVEQPLGTGERYSVTNFTLGLGYGVLLTDRVSVGGILNYVQESIWHSSLYTFGLNFGVLYQVEENGLSLGASVSNFGPRSGYDGRDLYIDYDFDPTKYGDNDQIPAQIRTDNYPLPTMFRVGVSYPVLFGEQNSLLIAVDALHANDNNERINIGAEFKFLDNFSLRGGYRDLLLSDAEGGLVLGAGVKINLAQNYNLRFDYAWADYGRLDHTHRFTVGAGF
jgi:hypothetical protein